VIERELHGRAQEPSGRSEGQSIGTSSKELGLQVSGIDNLGYTARLRIRRQVVDPRHGQLIRPLEQPVEQFSGGSKRPPRHEGTVRDDETVTTEPGDFDATYGGKDGMRT
jgi:hypothetical protein